MAHVVPQGANPPQERPGASEGEGTKAPVEDTEMACKGGILPARDAHAQQHQTAGKGRSRKGSLAAREGEQLMKRRKVTAAPVRRAEQSPQPTRTSGRQQARQQSQQQQQQDQRVNAMLQMVDQKVERLRQYKRLQLRGEAAEEGAGAELKAVHSSVRAPAGSSIQPSRTGEGAARGTLSLAAASAAHAAAGAVVMPATEAEAMEASGQVDASAVISGVGSSRQEAAAVVKVEADQPGAALWAKSMPSAAQQVPGIAVLRDCGVGSGAAVGGGGGSGAGGGGQGGGGGGGGMFGVWGSGARDGRGGGGGGADGGGGGEEGAPPKTEGGNPRRVHYADAVAAALEICLPGLVSHPPAATSACGVVRFCVRDQ